MNRNKINRFDQVDKPKIQRSKFDLSNSHIFTTDMGILYVTDAKFALPGDVWSMGQSAIVRLQPLVAPFFGQLELKTWTFACPLRLLMNSQDDWQNLITRGELGVTSAYAPLWSNVAYDPDPTEIVNLFNDSEYVKGTLWDSLRYPIISIGDSTYAGLQNRNLPNDYKRRMYYLVWNEFFRDENLQEEITYLDQLTNTNNYTNYPTLFPNNSGALPIQWPLMRVNWEKDYFTAALPFQQKGPAVLVPIDAVPDLEFDGAQIETEFGSDTLDDSTFANYMGSFNGFLGADTTGDPAWMGNGSTGTSFFQALGDGLSLGASMTLDGGISISDLRLSTVLQRWYERNARAGSRLVSFYKSHFGVGPLDKTLQRPEFIGYTQTPVTISEVLQTAPNATSGSSDQIGVGDYSGHGITLANGRIGTYRVYEHSIIMTLMSVVPKANYQQGFPKEDLYRSTFDYPWPDFVHLSEQEIYKAEILNINAYDNVNAPNTYDPFEEFGYIGRYDELRQAQNGVSGWLRDEMTYWHLGNIYAQEYDDNIELNSEFILCNPRKGVFQVPSAPGLIVAFGNYHDVLRPLPYMAIPR